MSMVGSEHKKYQSNPGERAPLHEQEYMTYMTYETKHRV